jgi:hypothetical protein
VPVLNIVAKAIAPLCVEHCRADNCTTIAQIIQEL